MQIYEEGHTANALCNFLIWHGYKVISDKHCVERVQARRHKKRRINKKWLKRYGMKVVPSKNIYVIRDQRVIVGHPIVMDKLIEKIKEQEGK